MLRLVCLLKVRKNIFRKPKSQHTMVERIANEGNTGASRGGGSNVRPGLPADMKCVLLRQVYMHILYCTTTSLGTSLRKANYSEVGEMPLLL